MSPTTPAPASSTPRPATAAKTSTSGWRTSRSSRRPASITAIPYTVDADGRFTEAAPGFTGKRVITDKGEKGDANEAVIKALIEAGMLIARGRLKHQYPHSWRSKKPVIFRNTPQWFIAMDQPELDANGRPKPGDTLRHRSLDAIAVTRWVPPQGENRIRGMIESKPDWVISRQRAWGVPIAVFVRENGDGTVEILKDEHVDQRIVEAFADEGADAWYAVGARERFLGARAKEDWQKVDDILDVWFDSGSTHAFTLEDPQHFPALAGIRRRKDGGDDTVMYLEGSDQHRGWFHSSLIESSGTRGVAPFDVVLTHGFVLDENGRKMSKSLGNTVAPQDVIKSSGADILRMWVCASDYADDLRIGPEILKTTVETYRKLRNTIRWLLGNLVHFHPGDAVAYEDMPGLEKYLLHRLAELDALVRASYADFDYKRIFAGLNQFMTVDLSAFYFDIRKDTLYCDPISSRKRKACLTVLDHVFRAIATWLAPMLCFTAEEAWAGALSGVGLGPSRAVCCDPSDLARRRARQGVGRHPQGPPRGDRCARDRARQQADRVEPRGGAGGAYRRPRPLAARRRRARGRSRRGRACRGRHHLGAHGRRRGGAGGSLPARGRAGRRGRSPAGDGQKMRAVMENPAERRQRSRIPRRDAARRRGAARMGRRACQGLTSPLTRPMGSAGAARPFASASWWRSSLLPSTRR